jgi:hypothetical protein
MTKKKHGTVMGQYSLSQLGSKRPTGRGGLCTIFCGSNITLPALTLFKTSTQESNTIGFSVSAYGLRMFTMDFEQPYPQSGGHESPVLDPRVINAPLPSRCRTFRLSEIPLDMDERALRQFLDSLKVGRDSIIQGNSEVFSLVTYRSWQVASVSFHQEPDDFKRCKPDQNIYLPFPNRRIEGRAVPVDVTVDCDFYGMTPFYQSLGGMVKYE